jgi:hypothetical protein
MAKKTQKKTAKKVAKKASAAKRPKTAKKSSPRTKLEVLKEKFLGTGKKTVKGASKARAGAKASKPSDSASEPSGSTKSAHDIVAEEMPGMRVVASRPISNQDAAEHATGSGKGLDALRQRYFGSSASDSASDAGGVADSEIVMVEPKAGEESGRGPGPKAVIVSGGRIVGRQG